MVHVDHGKFAHLFWELFIVWFWRYLNVLKIQTLVAYQKGLDNQGRPRAA